MTSSDSQASQTTNPTYSTSNRDASVREISMLVRRTMYRTMVATVSAPSMGTATGVVDGRGPGDQDSGRDGDEQIEHVAAEYVGDAGHRLAFAGRFHADKGVGDRGAGRDHGGAPQEIGSAEVVAELEGRAHQPLDSGQNERQAEEQQQPLLAGPDVLVPCRRLVVHGVEDLNEDVERVHAERDQRQPAADSAQDEARFRAGQRVGRGAGHRAGRDRVVDDRKREGQEQDRDRQHVELSFFVDQVAVGAQGVAAV